MASRSVAGSARNSALDGDEPLREPTLVVQVEFRAQADLVGPKRGEVKEARPNSSTATVRNWIVSNRDFTRCARRSA